MQQQHDQRPQASTPSGVPAERVHELFCSTVCNLPYDLFAEDWEAIARTAESLNADPERYLTALMSVPGPDWTDPSDFHGPDAEERYRTAARLLCAQSVSAFDFAPTKVAQMTNGKDISYERRLLLSTMGAHIYPVYRVVRALEILQPKDAAKVIEECGASALADIRSYEKLRQCISAKCKIPVDEIIGVIEDVLAMTASGGKP